MIYDPVCGCNGITYTNECEATNAGVLRWEKGACGNPCVDPDRIDKIKGCPRIYKPVCGCNNKTYSNACEAERNGVTSWTNGRCKDD